MKIGLKIMLFIEAMSMFSGGLFFPIYAMFVEQVGGNILDAGLAASAFLISTGVLVFIISRWEDRMKHQEKMYLLGYLLTAFGYFGYTFVTNRMELFMVQIFLGMSSAIYIPVRDSLFTKFIDRHHEASEWGDWEGEAYVIPAIAAVLGAAVAFEFGFKSLFITMSVITFIGFFLGYKMFSFKAKVEMARKLKHKPKSKRK